MVNLGDPLRRFLVWEGLGSRLEGFECVIGSLENSNTIGGELKHHFRAKDFNDCANQV